MQVRVCACARVGRTRVVLRHGDCGGVEGGGHAEGGGERDAGDALRETPEAFGHFAARLQAAHHSQSGSPCTAHACRGGVRGHRYRSPCGPPYRSCDPMGMGMMRATCGLWHGVG